MQLSVSLTVKNANFGQIYEFFMFLWFKEFSNCILGISKIPTINFQIHSFLLFVKKILFVGDTLFCGMLA